MTTPTPTSPKTAIELNKEVAKGTRYSGYLQGLMKAAEFVDRHVICAAHFSDELRAGCLHAIHRHVIDSTPEDAQA